MFEKLEKIIEKYNEYEKMVQDPSVISNQELFKNTMKELNNIKEARDKYLEYKKNDEELLSVNEMINDSKMSPDEKEMFLEEKKNLTENKKKLSEALKIILLPKDPDDDKNVILEVRVGTGGEESALFAADLLRMYSMYAEKKGFTFEIVEINETGLNGISSAVVIIKGKNVYSRLKYEGGIHRVQRVPETESSGRVHTSATSIVILPERDNVEVKIDMKDVKTDVYHSQGAGGQSVNTTDSAVRLTHLPTGIVVTCQNERSQLQNKEKAMEILKTRLYEKELEEKSSQEKNERQSMVGSGDRSEKIRTYNFPQNRITDHRIGFTSYNLSEFLDGELDELIDALIAFDTAAKLAKSDGE